MEDSTFQAAVLNGLVSNKYHGQTQISPQLLTNDGENTIWETLRRELLTCQTFTWSVAFITTDMLVPLKAVMADLAQQGIQGTLITGDYLGFNQPRVFQELQKIPNLVVRIADMNGFHNKGYLFDHGDFQTMIIGSANLTRAALLTNHEWCLKISSRQTGTLFQQLSKELASFYQHSQVLTDKWLSDYQRHWQPQVPARRNTQLTSPSRVVPNRMQTEALQKLQALVDQGAQRGLVVSATGTGKTYLGAFAVQRFQPHRFLYVVHREQIAKKTLASFQRVIGGAASDYGLLTGAHRDWSAKYLFATVQTLSQPDVLTHFSPTEFDYLLIDEAHRAAAPSYHRILDYFTPSFILGMTATPERMDNQDVYQLFDYHLAYEIRLRDALEMEMLTPFHYVGVEDYEVDGEIIDETSQLAKLIAPQRVQYVLQQLAYYGYSGDRPCGLVFCSRQAEATALAKAFTAAGYPAVALTNQNTPGQRQAAVDQLVAGKLAYIITVDLFNEGIDIPALNQIVMMRNTQSPIVFTQQLGRGLRKYPGQEFVTVVDFIGNYKHNYLIPIALNQDRSRSKDKVRQEVKLPVTLGVSTINFSQQAATRILNSLEKVKLDSLIELRQAYQQLHQQLGRTPLLNDFLSYGSVDPLVFANNPRLNNYGDFLQKMNVPVKLTKYERQILTFVTKELLNGKRVHELLLLQLLLDHKICSSEDFCQALAKVGAQINPAVLKSVDDILSLRFFNVKAGKQLKSDQYGGQPLIQRPDLLTYQLNPLLQGAWEKGADFKRLLQDALTTGLTIAQRYDLSQQFTLYQQYSRQDVCRLLNWPLDVSAPLYGYRVTEDVCPIFITYQKDSPDKRNAIYNNSFEDGRSLRWYTRSPRHLSSAEVQRLLAGVAQGKPRVKLYLFVKLSDAVGKEFYYLGTAHIDSRSIREELVGTKKKAAVGMNLILDQPLSARMQDLLELT